ncbi:IMPACT family member in pol 5'region-like protein [Drosera capensis]
MLMANSAGGIICMDFSSEDNIALVAPIADQFGSNDDGEPSGTAGKPIYSAIVSSGLDRVMVVVSRYFGAIKLGTGGLVRAYGGVASECLRNAPTCLMKSKVFPSLFEEKWFHD